MKGKLLAVVGSQWTLTYELADGADWDYTLPDTLDDVQMTDIMEHLKNDVNRVPIDATDTYTFGKQMGRMSRLALIADALHHDEIRNNALKQLKTAFEPWLSNTNSDTLVYDSTYGGIVPMNGIQNPSADFGSGYYNDHHFHYGYFIHAAATIARYDVPYYQKHRNTFDSFVSDICNYNDENNSNIKKNIDKATNKKYGENRKVIFPYARHKDFFD